MLLRYLLEIMCLWRRIAYFQQQDIHLTRIRGTKGWKLRCQMRPPSFHNWWYVPAGRMEVYYTLSIFSYRINAFVLIHINSCLTQNGYWSWPNRALAA